MLVIQICQKEAEKWKTESSTFNKERKNYYIDIA